MSRVFFISDLHLGHKNILNFSGELRGGNTVEEHDKWLMNQICSVLQKRDILWILGDICFDRASAYHLQRIPCQTKVCLGNHDQKKYLEYWLDILSPCEVCGIASYKRFWLSHCPIHPCEMRGRRGNIHGHVHSQSVPDKDYYNVCVEESYGIPQSFEEIYADYEKRNNK